MSLSAPSTVPVTVTYFTQDGTATATPHNDYVPISPTKLTFGPGQTQESIDVVGYLDPNISDPLTFFVKLSNPVNATLASGQTTAPL